MRHSRTKFGVAIAALAMLALGAACTPSAGPTPDPDTTAATTEPSGTQSEPSQQESSPATDPASSGPASSDATALEEVAPVTIDESLVPQSVGEFQLEYLGNPVYSRGSLADNNLQAVSVLAERSPFSLDDYAAQMDDFTWVEEGQALCGARFELPTCLFDSADHGIVTVSSDDPSVPVDDVQAIMAAVREVL
ncbi:hypothetical protein GCM10025789_03050 [Tessaracoccus lubricantis]|uniref:DUF3558 domain-containing protein n=1 Tax=Tessaracoccus lubricantis TaxID=545543 RepID=A0ABP9EXW9_9ACTN